MSRNNEKQKQVQFVKDDKLDFPAYWSEDRRFYIRLMSVRNWGVHVMAPQGEEQFYLGSRLTLKEAKRVVDDIERAPDPLEVMKGLIRWNPFVLDAVKPEILARFDECFMEESSMEMTAKEKAMEILLNAGCTVETYQGEPVDLILKDLKMGFPDGIEGGFAYEEIADAIFAISSTDRGWKKQILFEIDGDAAHYDVTELYEGVKEPLRKLVESGEPFKTCWLNSKHELQGWQCERTLAGGEITVRVHEEMDEGTELVYDAMPEDVELTDAQMEEILDAWILGCDGRSETCETRVVSGESSLDDILETVSELAHETNETLKELYELMKGTVLDYLDLKGDAGDSFRLDDRIAAAAEQVPKEFSDSCVGEIER